MSPLRLIFMGTAELACASLRALIHAPFGQVVAVVTQPDRPKGRDLRLAFSPVKETAVAAGLPILQPERARQEGFLAELRALCPDLIVVAAYGQILPPALLALPPHGCLNVHTSLLPKYRGAAPIQWAILNGDAETGVTLMKMDAGLDTGDILTSVTTSIQADDTAETLHDRLAQLGADLLVRTIPEYVAGRISPRPQPAEGSCYARKISKEDGLLDWSQPAEVLSRRIRGFTPWPGAYTWLPVAGKPKLLKIWGAAAQPGTARVPGGVIAADKQGLVVACGSGSLVIAQMQLEGGRKLSAGEFLAGHPVAPGLVLGTAPAPSGAQTSSP